MKKSKKELLKEIADLRKELLRIHEIKNEAYRNSDAYKNGADQVIKMTNAYLYACAEAAGGSIVIDVDMMRKGTIEKLPDGKIKISAT